FQLCFCQSTNEVSTASGDFEMDRDDLEELDIQWQVVMLPVKVKKFIQRTGRNMDFKEKQHVSLDKLKIECYNCHRKEHFARECRSRRSQGRRSFGDNGKNNVPTNEFSSQALVAQDGLGGYDWSNDYENYDTEKEKHNKAKLELTGYEIALKSLESRIIGHEKNELAWEYGTQMNEMSNKSETDRFSKADGYHVVPSPITGNFLTPRAAISFVGLDEYAIRKKIIESKINESKTELKTATSESKTSETVGKTNEVNVEKPKSDYESVVSKPKINKDKVIIEDWNSNDVSEVSPETQTVKTQVDKIGQISKKEGIGFKKVKACFVCKSTDHLIKDCDFYDKKSRDPKLKNVVNIGQRVVKPVWDNAKRVNH
ncbi:ribonuclease H-like domain-containing protein, partial [Tanacetum coccineum]